MRRNARMQKPRKQARTRTSRSKKPRSGPATSHRPAQETGGSSPNAAAAPESADSTQMWGRTAGASAAARSAELERERARWAAGSKGGEREARELVERRADAW